MSTLPEMTLDNLAGGAAAELFDHELKRVAADVLDVNSDPKATRTITLKVTIKPGEERSAASVSVQCASKLGPQKGAATTMFLGRRVGGEVIVTQFDQNQMQLDLDASTKPTLERIPNEEDAPADGKSAAAGG